MARVAGASPAGPGCGGVAPAFTPPSTRRALLGAAGVALGGAVLAGCGLATQAPGVGQPIRQPVQLTWALFGSADELAAYERVLDVIHQHFPDMTFDKITAPSNALNDFFAKVEVLNGSGGPLDLFMSSPIWVPNLVGRGLWKPLDDLIKRDRFPTKDYAPASIDAFNIKGQQYAVMTNLNFAVVNYNQALLNRAGVHAPADTWTWADFLDLARQLGSRLDSGTWALGPGNTDLNNTLPWIWMNGGRILDDEQDPRKSQMIQGHVVDAVQWRADWALKHRLAPVPGTVPGSLFASGQIALNVGTLADHPTLAAQAKDLPWDTVALPRGSAGLFDFVGGSGHGLASGGKHPDAAWEALKYLVTPAGLRPIMEARSGVPTHLGMAGGEYAKLPPPPGNRKAVVETLTHLRVLPKVPTMLDLYAPVYGANLMAIYTGDKSVRDGCVAIDTTVNAQLSRT
jgi:multiple sugar transport system substrate-binding protein